MKPRLAVEEVDLHGSDQAQKVPSDNEVAATKNVRQPPHKCVRYSDADSPDDWDPHIIRIGTLRHESVP